MNKSELVARLSASSGLSKADVRRLLDVLFDLDSGIITEALRSGESVRIPGFGTFAVKTRAARVGRNPRTGEQLHVAASKSVKLVASRELKDAIRVMPPSPAKPRAAPPPPRAEPPQERAGGEPPNDVVFTAYHPKEVKPQTWYTFLAYAHLPDAFADVQKDSRARLGPDASEYGRGKGEATAVIKRGAEIVVVPELPGCSFNPQRASFNWLKDWHRAEFELRATPDAPGYVEGQAVNGRVSFYVGLILVGEAKIWTHLSATADDSQADTPSESATGEAYRKIFASYAHEDGKIVDAVERALKSLGDTFLRDVRSLRSGEEWNPALLRMIEQADIFQLFWSHAAVRSAYVKQEWQHALKQGRRDPFIRPSYWETPMPMPPAELSKLEFSQIEVR